MKSSLFYVFPILIIITSCGGGGGGGSSSQDPIISINPIIDTFTSSASSISEGDSITLSWSTTNTISCSGSGDWGGNKIQSGSESRTLSEIKTYSFILTCIGENPQNTVSKTVTVNVSESNNSSSNIYSENKDSYCSSPLNDSSSYFLEDFMSDTLSDEVFTYQESNGFCANPGCPNGDSDFVQGWGNNEAQYYTSCREGYSKN